MHRAIIAVGNSIRAQATFMGFSDAFALIGVVLIVAVAAVALMRKGAAAGGAAHWGPGSIDQLSPDPSLARTGAALCAKMSAVKEVVMSHTISIERVDHIGIRVRDLDRALNFYRVLGFSLLHRATGDDVAILHNDNGVELNLIFNANAGEPGTNLLMDVPEKYAGYTHMALRVSSIPATIATLKASGIAITQGPVSFDDSGQVSVFVRDADRNVIELRGREQGDIEGVTRYVP